MPTIALTRLAVATTLLLVAACGGGSGGAAPVPAPPPAALAGLDARPLNTSCVAPARPGTGTAIALTPVYAALSFTTPVALLQAPGDAGRWYVVEQGGRVASFPADPNVAPAAVSTFVDLSALVTSGGETGLLGMAFHPLWPGVAQVFLSYTRTLGGQLQSVISRFAATPGLAALDAASEQVLLVINQPYPNHKGGNIAFGRDGYLYAGFGDGGSGGDPHNNAQSLSILLGKMLRIDVGAGGDYAIPADNPFGGGPRCNANGASPTGQSCPEVWAYGLRNPWRWSFDRATGDLWAGDVGQDTREEIDVVRRGANYGWHLREASLCYPPGSSCATTDPLHNVPLVDPVFEYGRDAGSSVTGGYVYRGSRMPDLVGRYLFADFVASRLYVVTPPTPAVAATPRRVLSATDAALTAADNVASFAQGNDGELYVVGYGGHLYALGPAAAPAQTIPDQLSATGCVDALDATQPAAGLIPYAPNAAFWSDGAAKQRWLALPPGATVTPQASGPWQLPPGSVLMKHFRVDNQLVETRLLIRHPDGVWAGYTYEWNAAQSDALRVTGGKQKTVGAHTWIYPSESECLECHTAVAGRSLGLETAQLNGSLRYAATGRTANQIATLNAIGVLAPVVPGSPSSWAALPDPYGTTGSITQRARAYLHTNCSQCHQPGGPTPVGLDLRAATPLAQTGACDAIPAAGDLGIADARVLAPGAPDRSVLLARVSRRDAAGMPPLGSLQVDADGVTLLREWIAGLAACQ